MVTQHKPVLKEEVLHFLELNNRRLIVDGTLGDGGHTEAILRRTGPQCRVLGIDRDAAALERARKRLATFGGRVILVQGNYSDIKNILSDQRMEAMDGFLLDLGVSSPQLDTANRGFSFRQDGPLDMRMDASQKTTASDLLKELSDDELATIIKEYGEERHAKRIVRLIRKAQGKGPLETTLALSHILSSAARNPRPTKIHPATKTFQALRIAVNRELEHLELGLTNSIDNLNDGGRMVVISFHSLEDRRVKNFFRDEEKGCVCPPKTPICICGHKQRLKVLTRRPVTAEPEELQDNPRSSSAKLRAAERVYV